MALRDIYLLARGDVIVGTWGSTLTILAQELIAARTRARVPPTVTYCDLASNACMKPLPLLSDKPSTSWLITIEAEGVPVIHVPPKTSSSTSFLEAAARRASSTSSPLGP